MLVPVVPAMHSISETPTHTYICFFPFHTPVHKIKLSASHSFTLAWFNTTHTNTYCIVVHRILLNSKEACLLSQHLLYWQICSRFLRRVRFLGWAQKVSPNSSSGCTMPGNVPHCHCVWTNTFDFQASTPNLNVTESFLHFTLQINVCVCVYNIYLKLVLLNVYLHLNIIMCVCVCVCVYDWVILLV